MEQRGRWLQRIGSAVVEPLWRLRRACETTANAVAFALAMTALAFLLRYVSVDHSARFLTLYPAVALCALLAGPVAGLVATTVAAVAMAYFVFEPIGTFWLSRSDDMVSLTNFVVAGLVISGISAADRAAATRMANETRARDRIDALHRTTIDALHDGVLTFSPEGRILSANPAAVRILGLSEEALRAITGGFAAWSVLDANGAPLAVADFPAVRVFRSGRPSHGVIVGLPREGGVQWLLNHADPIVDPVTGAIDMVVVSITDFTDRLRAEHEAAESRARLASIFNALHEGVLVFAKTGAIVACNPSAARILGTSTEALLAQSHGFGNWALLNEDGAPLPPDDSPAQRAFRTGRASHGELIGLPRSGEVVWVLNNVEPIADPKTGEIQSVVVSFADITARRDAERDLAENRANLASIFAALHEAIVVFSPEGRVLDLNPAAERILQRSREDLMSLGNAFERRGLIREDGTPMPVEDYPAVRALRTGIGCEGEVIGAPGEDGPVWLSANAQPIRDPRTGAVKAAVVSLSNITERLRSERDLRDSRARFASIVESAMDAIVTVDRDQRIVLFNAAAERMFGCSAAEVMGQSVEMFVPPHLRERHAAGFRAFARDETGSRVMGAGATLTACRKDGREFPIEASISRNEVAGQTLFTVVHRDISARLEAERINAHLATVVNSSPDAILTVTMDGRIGTWNQAASRMFGYSAEEAVGAPISMLSFADRASDGRAIFLRVSAGEAVQVEAVRRRRDGSAIEVMSSAAPIHNAAGEVVAGVAILTDISERKRKERLLAERDEELRQTLDAAGLGVWWIDMTAGIVHCDPRSRSLLATADQAPLDAVAAGFLAEDRAAFLGVHDRLASPDRDDTLVLRAPNPDGTLRWLALTARSRVTERGGEEIWGTVQDITGQKSAEQALRQFEASRRLEALGRMTGGIAHDFNNLLTVISGNLQLLEMNPQDPSADRYIAEALRAIESGAALNRRLTTFARQRRFEPTVTSLDERIVGMVDLMHRSVGPTISVTANYARAPALVRVDPSEIENAVLNLVFNARDAMPNGGHIAIETANVEMDETALPIGEGLSPGPYVRLSVSDTGTGMAPEVKARAFEPFFTTKDSGKGTGLGLASLHGFVRQSGGFVTLYSELGRGTAVNIYLPRVTESGERPAQAAAAPVPRGKGETILMVEDDPDVARVTRERLIALGYVVRLTDNARQALTLVNREGPIDLVFSDIMMPGGLSGIDLARRLAAVDPALRILLTSGFAEEIARGSDETSPIEFPVLRKPYSLADLAQAIAKAIGRDGEEETKP